MRDYDLEDDNVIDEDALENAQEDKFEYERHHGDEDRVPEEAHGAGEPSCQTVDPAVEYGGRSSVDFINHMDSNPSFLCHKAESGMIKCSSQCDKCFEAQERPGK